MSVLRRRTRPYDPDAYPLTANAVSDEFDDGVLDAAWTWTTAPTSPGTVDETSYPGRLYIEGQTSDTMRFLRRSYVPGAGVAFTAVMKLAAGALISVNNFSCGLALLTSGDALIMEAALYADSNGSSKSRRVSGPSQVDIHQEVMDATIYTMLQRDASNNWTGYWSPDGMTWSIVGASASSSTTVAKLAIQYESTNSKSARAIVDFIRVFDSATFIIGA